MGSYCDYIILLAIDQAFNTIATAVSIGNRIIGLIAMDIVEIDYVIDTIDFR